MNNNNFNKLIFSAYFGNNTFVLLLNKINYTTEQLCENVIRGCIIWLYKNMKQASCYTVICAYFQLHKMQFIRSEILKN